MTDVFGIPSLSALLVPSAALLIAGALSLRIDRDRVGRVTAAAGFGLLSAAFLTLSLGYVTSGVGQLFLLAVSTGGLVFALHAIRLSVNGWDRCGQLATTAAAMLVIGLPFELYPHLQVVIQEVLTAHLLAVSNVIGYEPALESTAAGQDILLLFGNGGYLEVTRACTGIEAVALFGGIIVGARTTGLRKIGGFGFMLAAVYAVNMVRMVFLVAAMSGDWFGPLLTSTGTLETTYYVAEVGIGQPFVVLMSVFGLFLLSRWIPDVLAFPNGVLDTLVPARGDHTGSSSRTE